MMARTCSLLFALVAFQAFSPFTVADEPQANRIHLKQGCVLECPRSFELLKKENVAKIEAATEKLAESSTPALTEKVQTTSIALVAVHKEDKTKAQLSLLILPAEVSQEDLKSFDANQKEQLREMMHKQAAPQFDQMGIKIQKKWPAEIKAGANLSYFLWGYEFVDRTNVRKISLRAYYYTEKATFILGVSCHMDFYQKNKALLTRVLNSFDTAL